MLPVFHPWFAHCKLSKLYCLGLPCTRVREEESNPLLCGFTAMLFDSMPSAYEDSITVKLV